MKRKKYDLGLPATETPDLEKRTPPAVPNRARTAMEIDTDLDVEDDVLLEEDTDALYVVDD